MRHIVSLDKLTASYRHQNTNQVMDEGEERKNKVVPRDLAIIRRDTKIAKNGSRSEQEGKEVNSIWDIFTAVGYDPKASNILPGIKRKSISRAKNRLKQLEARGVRKTDRAYKRGLNVLDFRIAVDQDRCIQEEEKAAAENVSE